MRVGFETEKRRLAHLTSMGNGHANGEYDGSEYDQPDVDCGDQQVHHHKPQQNGYTNNHDDANDYHHYYASGNGHLPHPTSRNLQVNQHDQLATPGFSASSPSTPIDNYNADNALQYQQPTRHYYNNE